MNSQRVYLCVECVQDLIKEFGLSRPKDADKAIAKAEQYEQQIVDLKEEVESLQNEIDAISSDIVKKILVSAAPKTKTTRKKPAAKKAS